jgi:hypothetical protein
MPFLGLVVDSSYFVAKNWIEKLESNEAARSTERSDPFQITYRFLN